ncbi:MAG: PHP domain-containing protein [Christensenellales bacterium]|jgi:hypothetical protein|nr:MAG: PHP domain-containing protein [Oscillospiraceae bacterium]
MMTLDELREIRAKLDAGKIPPPPKTSYVNNHIHTTYSFSPYTPTEAVYIAWKNGLGTAGIMDHDSTAGAREFLEAADILDMPVTCGVECRVDMSDTVLCGRRINNPDQVSVAYVAMHGIPHCNLEKVNDFFAPYRAARNVRNRAMCERINELMEPYGISVDFDTDVLPNSNYAKGGTVTERHLMFALAKKIVERYQLPEQVVAFLGDEMGMKLSDKNRRKLLDAHPDFYVYDLLGVLKSDLIGKVYIPATDELPDAMTFVKMVHDNGGIAAYAYLGDVGDSVTGDKKSQRFEDEYLDAVVCVLQGLGFDAVTYMPTRNSPEQLARVMNICRLHNFFQISGEDINSPRQSFVCSALDDPHFRHLIINTYTLIGYEKIASENISAARERFSEIFNK